MSYNILVVDDHKFAVSIMEYHLIQYGYQVLKAYDGNLALQIAKEAKSKINLIITDLHMPKMNGIEFANALKRLEITKVPIILVTSDEDIKYQFTYDEQFQVFDDLLIKPISATQMYTTINRLVQNTKEDHIKSGANHI
jgi:CheY-like chemotaxis protein